MILHGVFTHKIFGTSSSHKYTKFCVKTYVVSKGWHNMCVLDEFSEISSVKYPKLQGLKWPWWGISFQHITCENKKKYEKIC